MDEPTNPQKIAYTSIVSEILRRQETLRPKFQKRVAARHARAATSGVPWSWYSGVYFLEISGFIKVGYAIGFER